MPFDGTMNTKLLNRKILISALRTPMPQDFRWDFSCFEYVTDCGTAGCAVGLAKHLGIIDSIFGPKDFCGSTNLGIAIGLDSEIASAIFNPLARKVYGTLDYSKITPQMVADKLEALND